MKEYYLLVDKKAVQVMDPGGKMDPTARQLSLSKFFKQLSSVSLIDTGILPLTGSGVLAVRGGLGHLQIAIQQAPNIDKTIIGKKEYDPNAVEYLLARPYKVIISDWVNDEFVGARQFYSMKPVLSYDDPLYHVNLPNINCLGYNKDVGVGWTCLYHEEDGHQISVQHKVNYVVNRMAGGEAYNLNNMSETDGFRLYKKEEKEKWTYSPDLWAAKTEEEVDPAWTLNEEYWVPVIVNSINDQVKHLPYGVPLNFGMALRGKAKPYYNFEFIDDGNNTPINTIENNKELGKHEDRILTYLRTVGIKGGNAIDAIPDIPSVNDVLGDEAPKATGKANEDDLIKGLETLGEVDFEEADDDLMEADDFIVLEQKMCGGCGEIYQGDDEINANLVQTDMGLLCKDKCLGNNYHVCLKCEKYVQVDQLQDWEKDTKICVNCDTITECPNPKCDKRYMISMEPTYPLIDDGCKACIEVIECDLCRQLKDKDKAHIVEARSDADSTKKYTLCVDCFSMQDICECGFLREMASLVDVNGVEKSGCMGCVGYRGNGDNFYDPDRNEIPEMEINHTVVSLKGLTPQQIADELALPPIMDSPENKDTKDTAIKVTEVDDDEIDASDEILKAGPPK